MALTGFILAFAILIYLSFKGWSLIPTTIIAVAILALTNGINIIQAIFVNYVTGIGQFVIMTFLVFAVGALFGKVMGDSKATTAIAYKLLDIFGTKNVVLVLLIATAILTYIGISPFVIIFSVYPILVALCTEAKLPKRLGLAILVAGSSTFTNVLPGNTTKINIILASALGIDITAGAFWGILSGAIIFILTYVYLIAEHKKAIAKGEGFVEGKSAFGKIDISRDNLPSVAKSIAPMVILMVIIFATKSILPAMTSVVIALFIATLATFVLFWDRLPNKIGIMNQGIESSISPLMSVAAIVGFSAMLQKLPIFNEIIDMVLSLNVHPLILLVLVTATLSIITANGLGTIAFFSAGLVNKFVALGIAPELILRFGLLGSVSTAIMPHCGGMIAVFSVTGTNHKECYKDMFMVGVVIPTIGAIISTGLAILF
jgi:H+/gluconate symporter-like permease